MQIPVNATVLDVGCGSGWATRLMGESALQGHVVGIDVSDEMARVAREESSDHSNVKFQEASAEDLPFEDAEFTHAFSMESLYYYVDMPRALKEMKRVLKTGGLFVDVLYLYQENEPPLHWISFLKLPVQLLSVSKYRNMF